MSRILIFIFILLCAGPFCHSQNTSTGSFDREVIDKVLGNLVTNLDSIPQKKDKDGSSDSPLTIFRGSKTTSSILDDPGSILFASYDFNATPALHAKYLQEFLKLKAEIAPYSEKEITKKDKGTVSTSFIYFRPLYYAEIELLFENKGSDDMSETFQITYYKKSPLNGKETLYERMLDRLLASVNNISSLLSKEDSANATEHYYSAKKPALGHLNGLEPLVTVKGNSYTYSVIYKPTSPLYIPKYIFEIRYYMWKKFKNTGVIKPGLSIEKPNELVFTGFQKENPGLEIRIRYFKGEESGLLKFELKNTLSPTEIEKLKALGAATK